MISTLSELIAQVESNNNPDAFRFEPLFKPSDKAIVNCMAANHCTNATARVVCAMSWGKYQIMGENIYTMLDYNGSIAHFLNTESVQDIAFDSFCRERGIVYTLQDILSSEYNRRFFATRWNGPGNIDAYSQRIMQEAKRAGLI